MIDQKTSVERDTNPNVYTVDADHIVHMSRIVGTYAVPYSGTEVVSDATTLTGTTVIDIPEERFFLPA